MTYVVSQITLLFFLQTLQHSPMREFSTLRAALDSAGDSTGDSAGDSVETLVFAQDLNASGMKKFLTGSLPDCIDRYASLTTRHWYECLREDRPSRLFLDVESSEAVDVDALVQYLKNCVHHMFEKEVHFQVLDSSSPQKTSYHLIGDLVFTNLYHIGAFVRRVLMAMHTQNIPERHAIDHAVYTRNRMFRIKGSTKCGSDRVLTHALPWHHLLVQVAADDCCSCLELDHSVPRSTSMHPLQLFVREKDGQWSNVHSSHAPTASELTDTYPLLPIVKWLDDQLEAATVRHGIKMTSDGRCLVPTRSKRCQIADRVHKGNHIWFCIDTRTLKVTQRCHDSVCGNEHKEIDLPPTVWERWFAMWSVPVAIPKNEKTLFNTSY